jgi:hypothetical protein
MDRAFISDRQAWHYPPILLLTLIMVFSVLVPVGKLTLASAAPYHGQVVDAETGKPIEGAVVVVEWHKKPRIAMGGINYFHNARETLTDAEGKFSLDSSPGIDWNPFTFILSPRIITFYPGYRPFTPAHPGDIGMKEGGLDEIAVAFEGGVLVRLRKLKNTEEARSVSMGLILAPWAYVPNLMRSINVQRKMAGLSEYIQPKD